MYEMPGLSATWIAAARASWFALPVTKLSKVSTGFSFERSYIESLSPLAAGAAAPGRHVRRPAAASFASRLGRSRSAASSVSWAAFVGAPRPPMPPARAEWAACTAPTAASTAAAALFAPTVDGRSGAAGTVRTPAFGSRTNWTSTGECQKSRARSVMRPENWLLTQSSLKRFGAAMLRVFASMSKATGANGLIHVTYCWGVNSRSSRAEQCCQNSFIKLLSLCLRRFSAGALVAGYATRPEAARRKSPRRLCHKGLRGQAGRGGVQDSWEVRRDSTAKTAGQVSYPQGLIKQHPMTPPVDHLPKLLTSQRKPV
ncbi:hypothetical protein BN2476_20123 [Paraburkholderia piptadeniae]|uniref:Uncharacterized protein n=1 Tax=Paraburkholderia piptadeniae TaxID=1701573 RepID=A0A1N7RJT2_9BURK|nr:hypothetical protein BN2476_20123 [Paraburkholderia piptadeniae]